MSAKNITTTKACMVINHDPRIQFEKAREFKKSAFITKDLLNSVKMVDGVPSSSRCSKKIDLYHAVRVRTVGRIKVSKTSPFLPKSFMRAIKQIGE